MSQHKGFTLIELLIVISIVALLSSVVLANLAPVRERGRIGAAKTFATHTYHAFGADAFGFWSFDEVGSAAKDLSENKFDLVSSSGGNIPQNSNTPTGSKNSLSISGGTYLKNQTLNTTIGPNLTLAGWVYFNNLNDGGGNGISIVRLLKEPASILDHSQYGLSVDTNNGGGSYLRALWTDSDEDTYRDKSFAVNLLAQKWYHFAVTFKGTAVGAANAVLYIDGRQVDSKSITSMASAPMTIKSIIIGYGYYSSATVSNALLDDVAVYNQTLLASDIEKIYAQGLPTHTIVNK